jgi:hypothetical protein
MAEQIDTVPPAGDDASVHELMGRAAEQLSRLVHDELRLAQAEVQSKAKKGLAGAGMFGAAGVVALFAVGALLAAGIIALAGVISAWLAALLVGVGLLVVAGVVALVGKRDLAQASPPIPTEALHSIQTDFQTTKEAAKR